MDGTLIDDVTHAITEEQLDYVQFVDISTYYVMVFIRGVGPRYLFVDPAGSSAFSSLFFDFQGYLPTLVSAITSGTGPDVQYFVTVVKDGQETVRDPNAQWQTNVALPINSGEQVEIIVKVGVTTDDLDRFDEIKVYRRPENGGAFGFVGSSASFSVSGSDRRCVFIDVGVEADYTHQPPKTVVTGVASRGYDPDVNALAGRTGCVYEQRLVMSSYLGEMFASRPGYLGNFSRNFPLSSDSALHIRVAGLQAEIYHMIDNDGLVVFTSQGVWLHSGALTPTNLGLEKKGKWVIEENVPPIAIPGAVLFVDRLSNTVRQLSYSEEAGTYTGDELSIFSDHLFSTNRVTSWAFQDGPLPLLWVTFADGTYAAFTYERNEQMRAWTRHDSGYDVEFVASANGAFNSYLNEFQDGVTLMVINKDGTRYIEKVSPRYATDEQIEAEPEYEMKVVPPIDAVVTWSHCLTDDLTDDDITLAPVTPSDWDGPLTLSVVNDAIFVTTGDAPGAVGSILRWFHPVYKSAIDLEVTARASNNSITVQPTNGTYPIEFPSAYATNPRLYVTKTTFTGLAHLNSESVSVVADGGVIASPNNDLEDYPTCTPSAGSLTLPESLRGAIVHIGRPRIADIKTLAIDTVEQRPVLLESKTSNKVYVKTHNSRGIYVGSKFPRDNGVAGEQSNGSNMTPLEQYEIDYEEDEPFIANRPPQPSSKRFAVNLPGDWETEGRICIRIVDPVHFEILSITPDLEDLRR